MSRAAGIVIPRRNTRGVGTTDLIAAVALGIAGLSAVLSIVSLVLAFRESSRRNEEIGHLRREADRRDEELGLLREQVTSEKEERQRQQQARISVGERIPASGSDRGIEYTVPVQNTGAYIATELVVELSGPGGATAGLGVLDRALVPGETEVVTVMTPPRDRYAGRTRSSSSGPTDVERIERRVASQSELRR